MQRLWAVRRVTAGIRVSVTQPSAPVSMEQTTQGCHLVFFEFCKHEQSSYFCRALTIFAGALPPVGPTVVTGSNTSGIETWSLSPRTADCHLQRQGLWLWNQSLRMTYSQLELSDSTHGKLQSSQISWVLFVIISLFVFIHWSRRAVHSLSGCRNTDVYMYLTCISSAYWNDCHIKAVTMSKISTKYIQNK